MFKDDSDSGSSPGELRNDRTPERFVRSTFVPALPPRGFRVEKAQNGIRCYASDRSKTTPADGRLSGSVEYRIRWVETIGSGEDIASYRVRSMAIGTIPASGRDGVEAVTFIQDPKFSSGYLFCVGVDAAGNESNDASAAVQVTNQILDDSVPADPTHVQISASGEYVGSDVVEMVSVLCRAPSPLGSFDGVQLFLKDYVQLGTIQEGEFHRHTSVAGGSLQFKVPYAICKRVGTGTISLTNGSAAVTGSGFLTQCQAGDLIVSGLVSGTIQTVNSNTSITLTSNWTGTSVTGATDYYFLGKVTVYAVSVSKGGTHRGDITGAPSATMLFDGSLGVPNAPSTGTATTAGNVIRLEFQQVLGTRIKGYKLYRGTGTNVALSSCTVLDFIPQPKETTAAASSFLQFEDSSFTTYQREQGQAFTYRVTTINEAAVNNESADLHLLTTAIPPADPMCRLDAPGDGAPTIPAGSNPKNLLFNSFPFGSVGLSVSTADTAQDNYMGGTANTDGRASGQPDYRGYNRWNGTGATPPGHDSATEVVLAAPGAGGWTQLSQRIGAWNNGTLAARRIDKGRNLMLAVYMRASSPTPPNGTITFQIAMMNLGTDVGYYAVKNRDSSDNFYYTEVIRGGPNAGRTISGSVLTYPNSNVIYAVFSPQTIPATVDQIEVRITHWDTNNGNNLFVTKLMLCYGDQLAQWTPEMVLLQFPNPSATVPGSFNDRGGDRLGWDRIP